MDTHLIVVRHAQSDPSSEIPEAEWPLTAKGIEQSEALCDRLLGFNPSRVFSSPYLRARDTAAPLAESLGVDVEIVDALRERKLAEKMIPDFMQVVERSWNDFDFALPNCESSRVAQARAVQVFQALCTQSVGKTIVAVSHGSLVSLFLNTLDPAFGFNDWQAMANPAIFRLSFVEPRDSCAAPEFAIVG